MTSNKPNHPLAEVFGFPCDNTSETALRYRKHKIKDRISFVRGDGLEVMGNYLTCPDTAFFIDPPYTAGSNGKRAGRRLYAHNTIDHEELFRLASTASGDVLMTYDNDGHVLQMAQRYNFATHLVPMKNTHHATMQELLIGRDLEWAHHLSPGSQLQLLQEEA